jgi:organic hydroperoxide reductase OsmC/OhrA
MPTMAVQLRSIPDTEAAVGWAGNHTIIVDRPEGKAGGKGLGFNGGQLLGIAIGGCLCNDLRYVAAERGIRIATIAIDVSVTFDGDPLICTAAVVAVAVNADASETDIEALIDKARAISSVSNSVQRGLPVTISRRSGALGNPS